MTERYNGWSNYETWCCHLWLSNEQATWDHWTERAADQLEQDSDSEVLNVTEAAQRRLGAELKESIADDIGAVLPAASMLTDLLTSAVQNIDYDEVAAAMVAAAVELTS